MACRELNVIHIPKENDDDLWKFINCWLFWPIGNTTSPYILKGLECHKSSSGARQLLWTCIQPHHHRKKIIKNGILYPTLSLHKSPNGGSFYEPTITSPPQKIKEWNKKSFHEEIRVQQPPLPLKQNRGKKKYTDKTPK